MNEEERKREVEKRYKEAMKLRAERLGLPVRPEDYREFFKLMLDKSHVGLTRVSASITFKK